ncbi:MAG: hypothetical protein ACWGHO_05090 [Candidatus Moraniibacteriota bacterium]
MSRIEKNKLKILSMSFLFNKNKIILFLVFCLVGTFSFTLKAKALAPLALWGIGALVAWLGGDAINMAIGGVENTVTYSAATGPLLSVFSWLLYSINWVISFLVGAAALLLEAALKPDLFNALVRGEGLYSMWAVVRDVLNLFFMLILLFSAFATIFQVEKYHLKKMIIMLVVMALLVNFSFAISRFVVDFSNSAMYFFVDEFFADGVATAAAGGEVTSKTTIIAELLGIAKLYQEIGTGKDEVVSLILLIIINFISFITIFSYAISLTVRMIALSILIAISPVGFVFAFFPATKGYADEWWGKLFKYAVSGPILVFFLMLAIVSLTRLETSSLGAVAGATLPDDPSLVALVSYIVLPVTFLWAGLIASQKMGGAASGMAMGMMKKTGNNIKGYGQKMAWAGFASTGIPGAVKSRYSDIKGGFDKSRENREAKIAAALGSNSAMNDLERKRYEEDAKKLKNFTVKDLEDKAKDGNVAAADELLSRKSLSPEVYNEAIKNSKDIKRNDDLTAKFKGANKETRIDIVASIDARKKANGNATVLASEIDNKIGNMNHVDFAKQDFGKIAADISKKIGSTDSLERAEGAAIQAAITKAFNGLHPTAKSDIAKNISGNQRAALGGMGIVV